MVPWNVPSGGIVAGLPDAIGKVGLLGIFWVCNLADPWKGVELEQNVCGVVVGVLEALWHDNNENSSQWPQ